VSDEFWCSRDTLLHIRDYARWRRVNPWSTLGVALVRATCQIPPKVAIPPLIGGHAAPNLFLALVGPSGMGKGASEHAARDAIHFTGLSAIPEIPELPVGTGEGIASTFIERGAETVCTAIFTASEVDGLAALMRRQGATLESVVRQLFTGETLGFANARKDTRVIVPRLSYRAGLIVGVQPLRSGALLDSADGGTPQRFLWLPVRDHDMPEQRPAPVRPLELEVAPWPIPDPGAAAAEIPLPAVAIEAIDAHQVAVHRGDSDVNPLDGHALLLRVKVAAALAVLEQRAKVTAEDWSLAGDLMAISTATREACRRERENQRRCTNRAKALDIAERDEIISDRQFQRCKQTIERWLDSVADGAQIARNDLRKRIKSDVRLYFDTAIAQLIDEGKIIEIVDEHKTLYQKGSTCTSGPPASTSGNDQWTTGPPWTTTNGGDQGKRAERPSEPGAHAKTAPGYTERVHRALAKARNGHPPVDGQTNTNPKGTPEE
jgi:hypothetical protein